MRWQRDERRRLFEKVLRKRNLRQALHWWCAWTWAVRCEKAEQKRVLETAANHFSADLPPVARTAHLVHAIPPLLGELESKRKALAEFKKSAKKDKEQREAHKKSMQRMQRDMWAAVDVATATKEQLKALTYQNRLNKSSKKTPKKQFAGRATHNTKRPSSALQVFQGAPEESDFVARVDMMRAKLQWASFGFGGPSCCTAPSPPAVSCPHHVMCFVQRTPPPCRLRGW